MEAPITLLDILRDWLNKDEFPIVSIVGWEVSSDEERGQIWVGDFDVATIYDTYIEFAYNFKSNIRSSNKLYAADPEFFTKLEDSLKEYLSILKNISDGGDYRTDRSRQDNEGFPR